MELKFNNDLTPNQIINKEYDALKYRLKFKNCKYNEHEYTIVQYDKDYLNENNIHALKNIRSLVFNENKELVCISPSKSVDIDNFRSSIISIPDFNIEYHIEGTMLNLFYDKIQEKWIYSTKSNIGATNGFFRVDKKGKTFREMFDECATASNININELSKDLVYSFVFQHIDNRLVSKFNENKLKLIRVFQIINDNENTNIKIVDYKTPELNVSSSEFTELYNIMNLYKHSEQANNIQLNNYITNNIHELNNILNSHINKYYQEKHIIDKIPINFPYVGYSFVSKYDGSRFRFRSVIFEKIRRLRGNQPKLEFHYLDLRKQNKITEFLYYFPEYKEKFKIYQSKLHSFTESIYKNYVSCYIKKENPLKEYPKEQRTHMFNIHQIYKNIKNKGLHIKMSNVIDYMNSIESHIIMYSINYNKRHITEQN